MELDLGGRFALGSLAPRAPRVEEVALHRQNAVKTRQKQRRTLRRLREEQRNQLVRQAAGADQTPRPAGFVEAPKPAAESRRVLLPTGACGRAQELRRISAQQFVRLHRQRPQPVARAFEQRGQRAVRPGDLHPQRLLLRGIQQQASVGGPLLPGSSRKALPIENVGRGPGGQPLG